MLTIRIPAYLFIHSLKVLIYSNNNMDSSPVRLLSPLRSILFPLSKVHSSWYPDALKPLNSPPPLAKYQCIPILGFAYRSRQAYKGASTLVLLRKIQAQALGCNLQRRKQSNRPQLFLGIKLYYLYPRFILTRQYFSKENQSQYSCYLIHGHTLYILFYPTKIKIY